VSERTLKWLIGALGAVVVAWAAVTFLGGRTSAPAGSSKITAFFQGLTPKEVASVHIRGPKDTVDLTQKNGVWRVNGASVDSAAFARLWTDVKDAKVQDLVSTNPKNHARLGVAADSTWKLTFDLSSGPRTLYVGKTGPTYTTTYVRLPDQNDVYTLSGGLRPAVVRTADEWRDKRIVSVDTSAVVHIEVKNGKDFYHLIRKDSTWILKKGGRPDTAMVRNILSELSDLSANGFYHPGDSLPAEGGKIVALNGMGDTLTAITVGAGEGDRWARARGDSSIYRVAGYRVDRMMPKRTVLEVKKPAPKGSAAKKPVAKAPAGRSSAAKKPQKKG